MIGVIYQILRDQSNHEKKTELQNKQNIFNIGATSHMANTIFNKHVEFGEEYLKETHSTFLTLFEEGPTDKTLSHANNLYNLKVKYAMWLTVEMNDELEQFEVILRKIGANKKFLQSLLKK